MMLWRLPRDLSMLRQALGPQRRLLPLVIVLGLMAATLEGVGIGLIIPMLGIIAGHEGGKVTGSLSTLFQHVGAGLDNDRRLVAIALGIFALIALKNLLAFINSALMAFIYGKAGHFIRNRLSRRLLEVGYRFFLQESPGRLLNIISNESWRASDAIQIALGATVSASAAIIFMAFLLVLSWKLTLFVALGLVLVQFVHATVSRSLKGQSRKVTSHNSELASRMLHLVHAGRLIRIFGQEERESAIFDSASDAVRRAGFSLLVRQAALPHLMEGLHAVLFLAVVVGAWFSGLSFPLIVAFVVLLYRMQPHVRGLQMSLSQLQGLSGPIEEVNWLLGSSGEQPPSQASAAFCGLRDSLVFENVSFRYPDSGSRPSALRSVNFEIHAGRSTAILGRSGAGKSTVVNLLCRFVEPEKGVILVDGTPLEDLDLTQWRSRIALASQELELVDGTIFENITYGQVHPKLEEAQWAARLAEAHEFVETLPQGYDTVVGYRGVNLSAGQRQRIALARALARDPDLLILDEATNAVDGLSEAAIVETLKSRAGRRTTIVISHHHRTISFCDNVVILDHGKVKRQAPLAELAALSMDELYEHRREG